MDLNALTGARIREIRDGLGITSEALSIDLGVSKSTVSQMENGKVNITIATLERVADIFKMPVNSLIPTTQSAIQINKDNAQNNFLNSTNINQVSPEILDTMRTSLELFQTVVKKLETKQ
jgi:transcriptional regulator with XRE-family HTH domain